MQIEGNLAQAEDAIMLDKDGFVSETNATNIVSIHTFIKTTSRHLIHDCSKLHCVNVNCSLWSKRELY
jgi:hypothetical protein